MPLCVDHYNSPIYGMLIHRRHLLQTLVRLLLKFASTVSMSILSVYTVSARARLYGLSRSLVLLLHVNHQATASQTNKLLENQCSPKHCRNFDCRTKICVCRRAIHLRLYSPHPEGCPIHPIKLLRFVKGSLWTVLPEVNSQMMRLVITEIW